MACAALAPADDKDSKDKKKDDRTKSEPTVVATYFGVSRKLDVKEFPRDAPYSGNTYVTFLMRYPGKALLEIDQSGSKVSMKDDKGNVLLDEKSAPQDRVRLSSISEDRTAMTMTVSSTGKTPGKGATKVMLKGALIVLCGLDEKTAVTKPFAFEDKAEKKLGDLTLTVQRDDNGLRLNLQSKTRGIKRFAVEAGGKTTDMKPGSWFTGSESSSFTYYLDRSVKEGNVTITYYSKEEKVKVPLDLSVGASLGD